jgi:signal transduction histidine kinase
MDAPVGPAEGQLSSFVSTALRQDKLSGIAEMLRFIAEAFDGYACILWRLAPGAELNATPAEGRLFVLAQWLREADFWSSHILTLISNTGSAIIRDAPINVPDVRSNALVDQSDPLWVRAGVSSFCSIPIRFLDGQAGAINVYRSGGPPFSSEDISRIQELALLVPALYQTIRDKVSSSLASRINAILHDAELRAAISPPSPGDMKQVVSAICSAVGEEFHAAEVSVFFEDRLAATGRYGLVASTWKGLFLRTEYRIGEPALTSWIVGQGQSVNIFDLTDFRNDREKARIQLKYVGIEWSDSLDFQSLVEKFFPAFEKHGIRPLSFMGSPIRAGQDVLGVIRCCAALEPPYYFADGELRLLELVAAQLSHYWMNWTVRRESEDENQSWRTFVERVSEMNRGVQAHVIAGVLDQNRVFEDALALAEAAIPGAETLDVRLLDESSDALYYGPTRGHRWDTGTKEERHKRLQKRYPVHGGPDSFGAQVARSAKSFVMDKPEPLYQGPFTDTTGMIVVPLRSGDHVVGVMDIRTSQPSRFPKYAVSIAELLGQQLGLYQDLATAMRSLKQAESELKSLLVKQTATYEDLGHQLRSPVFQAEARIQSVFRSRILDDDLRQQLSAVRGLIGKTKRVSMNIRLFAQLADKKIVPMQPTLLNGDDLTRVLIEYASDHKRLQGPDRRVGFVVDPKGFGTLRTNEVRVDYDLLGQAVNNVLDNAFKYSFPNTVVRVQGGVPSSGLFQIAVRNEGIRLRPAEVEKAKERGWRSEEAESTTGEGSGIGLWIVDQIMKALGGELRISPTNADGLTEVRMLFPISPK